MLVNIFLMKNFEMNYFFFLINLLDLFLIMIMIIPSNLYNFHPLTLSILLILYTIILSFKLNLMINSFWYSYILFLVMVGGLMILFMYFTSLVNNQMFYLNKKYYMYMNFKILFLIIFFLLILFMNKFNNLLYMNFFELINLKNYFLDKNLDLFKNLMMDYTMDMNLYTIIYLFFMMICSVLICSKTNIPLRQIFKFN